MSFCAKMHYSKDMCADYTPSRKEQIEDCFSIRSLQLDLPSEAWPGYMPPILRGSHAMTCSKLSGSGNTSISCSPGAAQAASISLA